MFYLFGYTSDIHLGKKIRGTYFRKIQFKTIKETCKRWNPSIHPGDLLPFFYYRVEKVTNNTSLCEKAENFTYQHFVKKSSGLQGGTSPFLRQGRGREALRGWYRSGGSQGQSLHKPRGTKQKRKSNAVARGPTSWIKATESFEQLS